MSLPTATDLKDYLRIEHTAEDALLAQLVAQATAAATRYLRRAIAPTRRTFYDLDAAANLAGRSVIFLPEYPVDARTLTVTDKDDVDVDSDTYRIECETGRIIANISESFDNGPYSVDCKVGLAAARNYVTVIEPDLSTAILDIAADRYQHRNPNAQAESAGGGVTTQYFAPRGSGETASDSGVELPARAKAILESWRKPRSMA